MKKFVFLLAVVTSCRPSQTAQEEPSAMQKNLLKYATVRLTADLDQLDTNQRQMVPLLIEAAKIMDELFWYEAYGDRDSLLSGLSDEEARAYVMINYGPWDRLSNNEPFIEGVGPKPPGANFYPVDMTRDEFEAADLEDKSSLYTLLRRDEAGSLITIPYREMFEQQVTKASALLKQAAELADNEQLKNYLLLRSEALLTDNYQPSDMAWMDMKSNQLDVVIGPIETYEDQLYGQKAAHEAYVLIKDMNWSKRLERYVDFLADLQKNLPVDERYKAETPGSNAELNAYDVIFYAGDCNSGSKTIAINLPNDEEVQLQKGSRRLQLKNAMKAKFDKIMVPISEVLVAEEQRQHVTFDAFFANTMFHEVAHGLGIKNTIDGSGTVRQALKEYASALEEGKADILGLYMITQLHQQGEIEGDLNTYYVTFMAGIFRSVRFGAASAHGKANMIRFNYFNEFGVFERNEADGTYKVNIEKLTEAMNSLSALILTMQGNGDYDGVAALVSEKGLIGSALQVDLARLSEAGIPVDIIFDQGVEVLGL